MATFSETWEDYGYVRRLTFIASLIWGFGIVLGDVMFDVFGFWQPLSVLPAVLVSLGGFLIGVPVALVLLSTLQAEREEKSEYDKLERLSSIAWRDFSQRVDEFCSDDRIAGLKVAYAELSVTWASISKDLGSYAQFDPEQNMAFHGYLSPLGDDEYRQLVERLPNWADDLDELLQRVSIPRNDPLEIDWVGVQRGWVMLDTYVKIQRFASNLAWLSRDIDNRIQRRMLSRNDPIIALNPIGHFSRLHDGRLGSGFIGMQDVPICLRMAAELNPTELGNFLRRTEMPLKWLIPSQYQSTARAAAALLEGLRRDVRLAEDQPGWPPKS